MSYVGTPPAFLTARATSFLPFCRQTDLASMRSALREEVGAIREAAYAAIGGFHAACRTAAKAHAERTAQLLGADAAVQKLGPGGVAGLVADCEGLRGRLADLKGQLDRAQAELAAAGVAQRRLTADAELKTRELQVCTTTMYAHAIASHAHVEGCAVCVC